VPAQDACQVRHKPAGQLRIGKQAADQLSLLDCRVVLQRLARGCAWMGCPACHHLSPNATCRFAFLRQEPPGRYPNTLSPSCPHASAIPRNRTRCAVPERRWRCGAAGGCRVNSRCTTRRAWRTRRWASTGGWGTSPCPAEAHVQCLGGCGTVGMEGRNQALELCGQGAGHCGWVLHTNLKQVKSPAAAVEVGLTFLHPICPLRSPQPPARLIHPPTHTAPGPSPW